MINTLRKTTSLLALLILSVSGFAQQNQPIEMADGLYQSGKIYVVITVLSVIFAGIIIYLIMLDRKIGKLEKDLKNK